MKRSLNNTFSGVVLRVFDQTIIPKKMGTCTKMSLNIFLCPLLFFDVRPNTLSLLLS